MRLFKILEKEKNKKSIKHSDEMKFYLENRSLLNKNPNFDKYIDCSDIFDILCANIIISSIQNKAKLDNIIEEEYLSSTSRSLINIKEEIKDKILDLPYLKIKDIKVYVPIFNVSTNYVYSINNEKMTEEPYVNLRDNYNAFLIDPFATYGVDLFDSMFTKLVRIEECPTAVAFYHFDFNAIFIINRQGGLDNIIYLFDKKLRHPKTNRIVERIRPVINAYFDGRLNDFIYLLYKNELISYSVFRKICKEKGI